MRRLDGEDVKGFSIGKLFVMIIAFLAVLAATLTLALDIMAPSAVPSDHIVSDEENRGPEIDGEPDPEPETDVVIPSDPTPAEPEYVSFYGDEYSTFCLPRNTEEFAFVEKLMEIAFSEPKDAEDENGVTKYGTYFGTPAYEWCTEFAVWCIVKAQESMGVEYVDVYYPFEDWSGGCIAWYKSKGLFFKRGSYVPRRGDMIFFDYDYDGVTDHTGLVYGIEYDSEEDKLYVLTIEGNLPEDYPVGSIKERRLAIDWKKIYGYGTFLFSE